MKNQILSLGLTVLLMGTLSARADHTKFILETTSDIMTSLHEEGWLNGMNRDALNDVEMMARAAINNELAQNDVDHLSLSEEVRQEFLGGVFDKIKKGLEKVGEGIKSAAGTIGKGVQSAAEQFAGTIKGGLKDVGQFMKENGPHIAAVASTVLNVAKPVVPVLTTVVSAAVGVPIPPQLVTAALAMADKGLQMAAGKQGAPSDELTKQVIANIAKLTKGG